ncbi:MAG: Brp/Blh family beta-carotene 15,15'-dioxygenase [Wenzhouxiangellaceae bacterium]|nr:Brp/Blh family beta-carotene 15,15'-dioxygenase [Wenzhouxiangellaceae bacterium]
MRQVHLRIGLIALLSLVPASALLASVEIETQLVLVALPIALLGVMHGALDPWVGDVVLRRFLGRSNRPLFFGAYLALMAVVVACWIVMPLQTLVAFLLISVLHFGEQDAFAFASRKDGLSIAVFGAVPVLGPVAAHPVEVAMIFGWLTGMDGGALSEILRWLARPLIALWLVGAGMFIARMFIEDDPNPRFQLFGLLVLVASMLLLPPLIAFAAYFCLLHSFGHLLDMAALESGPWADWTLQQWAARLWPATLGALALGLVGWVSLSGMDLGNILYPEALSQIIFCGLAALTVPHVLLHMAFGQKT